MPKQLFTKVQLPLEQPSCCAACPLLGLIPQSERPKGSKETHVCLGTMEALTGRGVSVRASNRDTNHPLRRPCDNRWEAWMTMPGRKIGISNVSYIQCRIPYEQGQQLQIKFHK